MSKIVSIGTAVPTHCHQQHDILQFMQTVYAMTEVEKRKLRFLYQSSGIKQRYSVLPDYSSPITDWKFYPRSENLEPFPSLEHRMAVYHKQAPKLSVDSIRACFGQIHHPADVTHLITVSCTGMSAPGLDLQVMDLMDLNKNIFRTSVNFMGCYAVIHALKIADVICKADKKAQVLIVSTELCTLHFQKEATLENMTSSLLFGDGSAAALVTSDESKYDGLFIDSFYSEIISKGKSDMAWELSSSGFLMTLSSYIPDLIEEDFLRIARMALQKESCSVSDISHWCIHPGGKRILESITKSLQLQQEQLADSYRVLNDFGNLSSASILFVMKEMLKDKRPIKKMLGAAFGPGLTVETFTAHS